jgi:hypothetical protein
MICSDSQAALKVLRAVRTSLLVRQCREALGDISTRHTVGLYWVSGMQGYEAMRLLMGARKTAVSPMSWVRSWLWGSLGRNVGLGLIAGWGVTT